MWSIGLYRSDSSFEEVVPYSSNNPVLTKSVVKNASFVADPFMLRQDGMWYLFFELMNIVTKKGDIGVACSRNLIEWIDLGIVLSEKFHLSYPFVFEYNGNIYMIPETLGAGGITLYIATEFPLRWKRLKMLIDGQYADPTILRYNGLWWIFACGTPHKHDSLYLFWATDLMGPWYAHKRNPIYANNNVTSRPAGRIVNVNGDIIRPIQNCKNIYGESVLAAKIVELTKHSYLEELIKTPILNPTGNGWNAERMHHIDCHFLEDGSLVACVDGFAKSFG